MELKKITYLLIIFSLILVISACKNSDKNEEDNWEDEVLLASECGMDGLKCCVAPDEACKYGQSCCINPQDINKNFCGDDCTLGKEASYCRLEAPRCDVGFACKNGKCMSCGGEEEPCCYVNTACANGLVCNKETCEKCGLPGNVCCETETKCLSETLREDGRTECRGNNICSFCGYSKKVVCQSEPFCNPAHLLNNDKCYRCGELNQPCCKIDALNSSECNESKNLTCELGFCTKK